MVFFWRWRNGFYKGRYVEQREIRQLHVIQKALGGIIKQGEATEILPMSFR
jgi:hypothetical protein